MKAHETQFPSSERVCNTIKQSHKHYRYFDIICCCYDRYHSTMVNGKFVCDVTSHEWHTPASLIEQTIPSIIPSPSSSSSRINTVILAHLPNERSTKLDDCEVYSSFVIWFKFPFGCLVWCLFRLELPFSCHIHYYANTMFIFVR